MIGETISHFQILERLAKGGMGEVYKAEDLRLRRMVALKMLLEEELDNEEACARFLREAQAASALNHPNIATIYEVDEIEREGKRYSFIAMEYVQGKSIKELAGKVTVDEAIKIIMQIADALSSAHEMGIIHRDIKPSNLILDDQGRVKVLDFGIAKFTSSPRGGEKQSKTRTELILTAPGSLLGTFNFMSPEQALGQEVDHRTDIFSLGILFYDLLTGTSPFTGNTPIAVANAIIHSDPPTLTRLNLLVSTELNRVVLRMLEKDRERRYQDLRAVYFDLDAIKRGSNELLTAATYENVSDDSMRKYVVPSVAEPMAGAGVRSGENQDVKSVAVMAFSNITKNPDDDWLGPGIAETVTSDLKNIEGIAVIGRERIGEVLNRLKPSRHSDLDDELAIRIGKEMSAHWMICGGFQRFGEMVRITSRVVDVMSGEVLKTVKIDGQMAEIFELQDKVVFEFMRNANLSLRRTDRKQIEEKETKVFAAYEAFSKGLINLQATTRLALDEAIRYFEEAIVFDPNYARARVYLGYVLSIKAQYLIMPELYEDALANMEKAGSVRPLKADEQSMLGLTLLAMGRDDEAIESIKIGLEIDPGIALIHTALGRAYFIGKGEFSSAALEFEEALALDQQADWAALQLAHCCAYLGNYARGELAARQAIEAQEEGRLEQTGQRMIGAYTRLGQIHYLQGNYDQAIAEFHRELLALDRTDHALKDRMLIEVNQRLASAYLKQGSKDDARTAYERVIGDFMARVEAGNDDPFTRYYVACAHAMMGNSESAINYLVHAAQTRRLFTVERAKIEPDLESLRTNSRFLHLLQ